MTFEACYGCDYLYMEKEINPFCTKLKKNLNDILWGDICIENGNVKYNEEQRKVKIQD